MGPAGWPARRPPAPSRRRSEHRREGRKTFWTIATEIALLTEFGRGAEGDRPAGRRTGAGETPALPNSYAWDLGAGSLFGWWWDSTDSVRLAEPRSVGSGAGTPPSPAAGTATLRSRGGQSGRLRDATNTLRLIPRGQKRDTAALHRLPCCSRAHYLVVRRGQ
jgi:hypothetical protein